MKKLLLIFLLLSVSAFADDVIRSGNITLLALVESNNNKSGTVASLSLELRPGSERVFLETFPMTKVTTQASLRFAQQIACQVTDVDCSKYDFLFTITALPGIVGGPSAGAAAALLASSLLLNKSVPHEIAMTGTINSGGLVGPVGGLKDKVHAAGLNGVKIVLLPRGTKDIKDESANNASLDLVEFGRGLNLSVLEVSTLGEVLEIALGVPQERFDEELVIEGRYKQVMSDVANTLCSRNEEFLSVPLKANLSQAKNFSERSVLARENGASYAAASYCFRSNVEYKKAWFKEQNFSNAVLLDKVVVLESEIDEFRNVTLARSVSSLTDLQTFMAVTERLDEASDLLAGVKSGLLNNKSFIIDDVGFAEERFFSAVSWSRFFDGADNGLVIDSSTLRSACAEKISEAEERFNYVKSIIPEALDNTRKDIDKSYVLLSNGKFSMCLYSASKAKSEADVLLSVMGVEEKRFGELIALKLNISRNALMKAQRKGIFPIIGYSYYEYADSLKDFDRISSLLFSEYALELSTLDIYFKKEPVVSDSFSLPAWAMPFGIGVIVGCILVFLFRASSSRGVQTLQAPSKRRLRGKKR